MVVYVTGGQGLALAQTMPPFQNICNLNKLKTIYMLRTIGGCVGWATLPKALPLSQRSRGRVLLTTQVLNHCLGDTWWPLLRPHVTNPFATNMPRVRRRFVHMSSNQHLPCVIQPCQLSFCHMSYGPTTCRMALPRQHPYGLYGLYNQHIFFACLTF
jgi:hypothetical protein